MKASKILSLKKIMFSFFYLELFELYAVQNPERLRAHAPCVQEQKYSQATRFSKNTQYWSKITVEHSLKKQIFRIDYTFNNTFNTEKLASIVKKLRNSCYY